MEKEKQAARAEADDSRSQTDSANKARSAADKLAKQLEAQLTELSARLEDSARLVSDVSSQRAKLESANNNLVSQLEEADTRFTGFAKVRAQLQAQIEDARRAADEESRAKSALTQQLRNLSQDLEVARIQEEEYEGFGEPDRDTGDSEVIENESKGQPRNNTKKTKGSFSKKWNGKKINITSF